MSRSDAEGGDMKKAIVRTSIYASPEAYENVKKTAEIMGKTSRYGGQDVASVSQLIEDIGTGRVAVINLSTVPTDTLNALANHIGVNAENRYVQELFAPVTEGILRALKIRMELHEKG
jgi:hypothetical protein